MLQQILDRIFPRSTTDKSSRDTARKRLQLVLAHDRIDLSPAMVEKMREEILEVVSRYVEIEPGESEFALENDQRTTVLIANLPIKRVKAEPVGQTPLTENFAPGSEFVADLSEAEFVADLPEAEFVADLPGAEFVTDLAEAAPPAEPPRTSTERPSQDL
ncbi:cell division topological specificity factor MinE [Leptolyngbya ohadii]|uniref:cell division topological specificity factor MinE n=1 Tax=Leptolyngbya ohadii TaxID=1962290 RepID=UPI000B5985FF|nr:cell division topological specificity factor MinE [Leptolyngbya ohadii]